MNILGTGLSGLVGSRIVEILADGNTFENLSLETGVDITNKEMVDSFFSNSVSEWVFHLAAYTDVQGAEREKELGEQSAAWKVNVLATEHIVENCRKYKKKLLYLDTDYAFDGTKKLYTESDEPNPLGWYAITKHEGALRALTLGGDSLILRISNPYRAFPVGKKDFVHKMLERLQSGQGITAPHDQLFVPTFIDDIAHAIGMLMNKNCTGIYHTVGSSALSPYEAAVVIADMYHLPSSLVSKTTFQEMFKDRAPAPQYAVLDNTKLKQAGYEMKTFYEGVSAMKKLEDDSKIS